MKKGTTAKFDAALLKSNLETMATAALCVASADGNVDPREKVELSERLGKYAAGQSAGAVAQADVRDATERAVEMLLRDGVAATLRRIATVALAPEVKRMLLEVSVFVAGADGRVADSEVRMLKRIATTIGLGSSDVEQALATIKKP